MVYILLLLKPNFKKTKIIMRKILLFASSAFLLINTANAQIWVEQNSNLPTVNEGVRDIFAVNDSVVWILGYDGSGSGVNFLDFAVTTDGGDNFVSGLVGTDTTWQFSNITAVSADTAWVAMFDHIALTGGGIWRTIDAGANWVQQDSGLIFDALSFPDVVHFWNGNDGVAIGDPNNGYFEIYTTVNGGDDWTRVPQANIPNEVSGEAGITDWYDVYGDNIWFYTSKGRVYHSTDKGYTWTVASVLNLPATQYLTVRFFDANEGIAIMYTFADGAFASAKRTHDGGASWSPITATGNVWTSDLAVIPNTGVIVSTGAAQGFSGSSFSLDSGLTWADIDNGVQHTALDASSYNGMWSGGFSQGFQSGGIFKYDGYNLGVHDNKVDLRSYNLYPNPSTGVVTLNVKSKSSSSNVQVIDAMGKIVFNQNLGGTLVNKKFDFSSLSKGVYSLIVISGNERSQSKLVIQ
jgi:hypothetical protein